jgi:hypothetical protein
LRDFSQQVGGTARKYNDDDLTRLANRCGMFPKERVLRTQVDGFYRGGKSWLWQYEERGASEIQGDLRSKELLGGVAELRVREIDTWVF